MLTPEENIVNVLKGKRVLFLENDTCFSDDGGQKEFVAILDRHGIEHTDFFELIDNYTLEEIVAAIKEHDALCFMTQWLYNIAGKIFDFMYQLQDKKIVIEIHSGDPTWYYKPDVVHDVYIYKCSMHWGEAKKDRERFYKLSDKPYWDYENKFDK